MNGKSEGPSMKAAEKMLKRDLTPKAPPFYDPANARIVRLRLQAAQAGLLDPVAEGEADGPRVEVVAPIEGADMARVFMAEEAKKNAAQEGKEQEGDQ